jgi:hypothetical protein
MRIAALIALVLSPLLSFGQSKDLPDVLKPDQDLIIFAESSGFEVAKILPRGTFAGPFNAYKDEENPLGIREGGAYYSFSTRQHSYNMIPQIGLDSRMLGSGFAGLDYGLLADLGLVSLDSVGDGLDPVDWLLAYKPPLLHDDIRAEQKRFNRNVQNVGEFGSRVKATVGSTYILRSISFDKADKLVAFSILRMDAVGAITIAWRTLKDFEIPFYLHQSDESLAGKVAALLKNKRYAGTQFSVDKGIITVRGFSRDIDSQLSRDLQALRPRGVSMSYAPIN